MQRSEGFLARIGDRLSGREKVRDFIEKNVKIGNEARAVLEEAYQHIFTVSLMEYAAQQGKDPKDYSIQQVSARSNEEVSLVAEAEVLKNLREQMNREKFEAIVGFQLQSTPVPHDFDNDDLLTNARGTAVRLNDPQTS